MSARILIVDDMLPSVKVLAAKLTGEYYEVLTATDGPSALEIIGEQDPDLVLLDIMMPGIDGLEVCRRIKDNPETNHIPVIMVTALSDSSDRVRGLEAGADDFLTKPVSDDILFARVNSLVRLKRILDQWRLHEETTEKLGYLPVGDSRVAESVGEAHIVLVDESPIQSANIQDSLAVDKNIVTVVGDFDTALGAITEADPDVAIISFPGESVKPMRLCSQLRSLVKTRLLPILLIGDEEYLDLLIKALDLGVNDYVLRPMDAPEFLARVRAQIRRRRYQERLHASFLHSMSLALIDSLTGLHNRRYLASHLEAVVERMSESRKPVSLLMIDIDHFKQVNDTHGHAVGDKVLCRVAEQIADNVRGFDLASRYGGEEFVIVMPDADIGVSGEVAERLCRAIADQPLVIEDPAAIVQVTVSIGVAEMRDGEHDPEKLLKIADDALYQAKEAGRNRVVLTPAK